MQIQLARVRMLLRGRTRASSNVRDTRGYAIRARGRLPCSDLHTPMESTAGLWNGERARMQRKQDEEKAKKRREREREREREKRELSLSIYLIIRSVDLEGFTGGKRVRQRKNVV